MKIGSIYVRNQTACLLAVGLAAGVYFSNKNADYSLSGLSSALGRRIESSASLDNQLTLQSQPETTIIEKETPLTEGNVLGYVRNNYDSISDAGKVSLETYVLEQTDPKEKWRSMNDDSKIYFVQHGYRDLSIDDQRRALHVLLGPVIKSKVSHVFDKIKGICGYGMKRLEDELQDEDPVRYKANYSTLQTFIGEGNE